jgi:hypothetical protein
MTDLARMSPEEHEALKQQMRLANTARMKNLLDAMEPYVDGSLGPVSAPHVSVYLKVCRELGLLWHAYDKPAAVEAEVSVDEEVMVLQARQEAVLAELAKLHEVSARRPRT